MSRATAALLATVDAVHPGGRAANDELSAESATDGESAGTDLVVWIDALALTLAAGLRVGAAGLDRLPAGTAAGDPEVMDADQLAVFLGVDRKTVYDYAGRGEIPHQRLGKRLLFSRSAIVAWLGTIGREGRR